MSGIEITTANAYCTKCGTKYGRRKGYFPVNYGLLYKGLGYITVCRQCIDDMYERYLDVCKDPKMAVRQVCRKLDLYWSESAYAQVEKKNTTRSMMTAYITKINNNSYINKCYDDTLTEEGKLWDFGDGKIIAAVNSIMDNLDKDEVEVPKEVIDFWGPGLSKGQYVVLDQRRKYHLSRLAEERGVDENDIDLGTDMLIRQICHQEIAINEGQASGKDVNKSVTTLVDLLQKIDWKPAQKKEDLDLADSNTPLGVWLYRFENKRPLPEIDDDLKDVNGIKKYIFTWMGHLTKMLGIKGGYTHLYEEEVARLRVEKPEYDDEDDEVLLSDYYSENEVGDV